MVVISLWETNSIHSYSWNPLSVREEDPPRHITIKKSWTWYEKLLNRQFFLHAFSRASSRTGNVLLVSFLFLHQNNISAVNSDRSHFFWSIRKDWLGFDVKIRVLHFLVKSRYKSVGNRPPWTNNLVFILHKLLRKLTNTQKLASQAAFAYWVTSQVPL